MVSKSALFDSFPDSCPLTPAALDKQANKNFRVFKKPDFFGKIRFF